MKRWIFGFLMAVGVVAMIWFLPVWVVLSCVVMLSVLAAWEFFSMTMPQDLFFKIIGSLLVGIFEALMLLVFVPHSAEVSEPFTLGVLFFLIAVLMLGFVGQFGRKADPAERIRRCAFFVFGCLYVGILFLMLGLLFCLDHWLYREMALTVIAVTALSDTGAFVVGKLCGRHKMSPMISPNKTWEGFVGAFAGGLIAYFTCQFLFHFQMNSVWISILFSCGITVFGVLGDLAESLIKRGVGVKDSGKIIPGHGGILDRLDAYLFTATFVVFLLMLSSALHEI